MSSIALLRRGSWERRETWEVGEKRVRRGKEGGETGGENREKERKEEEKKRGEGEEKKK